MLTLMLTTFSICFKFARELKQARNVPRNVVVLGFKGISRKILGPEDVTNKYLSPLFVRK